MFRLTLNRKLVSPAAYRPAARFFSSTPAAQALKVNLTGTANGFVQELKTFGEGIESHQIKNDLFKALGGNDSAPDPIHHLFSSVSGCQNITANLVAKDLGINIGKAKIDIEADLATLDNTKGKYPGFLTKSLTVNYELETDANDEQFEELRETTEAKCPIAQVFINSQGLKFTSNWIKAPLSK